MIPLELGHILIQQHHAYLRSLNSELRERVEVTSRRETIGRTIIRFGRWVENRCPELPEFGTRTPATRS